jgi:hypothetical protein
MGDPHLLRVAQPVRASPVGQPVVTACASASGVASA